MTDRPAPDCRFVLVDRRRPGVEQRVQAQFGAELKGAGMQLRSEMPYALITVIPTGTVPRYMVALELAADLKELIQKLGAELARHERAGARVLDFNADDLAPQEKQKVDGILDSYFDVLLALATAEGRA